MRPDYPLGCKRVLLSDDYYPALQQPQVELITEVIASIDARGVRTVDGQHRTVDVIICATGFDTLHLLNTVDVRGLSGTPLTSFWSGYPRAYHGVTLPDYPNLILLLGPNTGTGHTSTLNFIERHVAHVMRCLAETQRREKQWIAVKPTVFEQHQAQLQESLSTSVWAGSCGSWYKNPEGRIVAIYPGASFQYRRSRRDRHGEIRVWLRSLVLVITSPTDFRARPARILWTKLQLPATTEERDSMITSNQGTPSKGDWLDAEELLRLALSASRDGNSEAAIVYLKRALEQSPTDARLHYLLGAEHAHIGLYDRAATEMQRAVELDAKLDTAHFQLGLLHLTSGRVAQAEDSWKPLDNLSEENALRLFKTGLLHLARDEFTQCADYLKRGIAANTSNVALSDDMRKMLSEIEGTIGAPGSVPVQTSTNSSRHVLLNAYRSTEGKGKKH